MSVFKNKNISRRHVFFSIFVGKPIKPYHHAIVGLEGRLANASCGFESPTGQLFVWFTKNVLSLCVTLCSLLVWLLTFDISEIAYVSRIRNIYKCKNYVVSGTVRRRITDRNWHPRSERTSSPRSYITSLHSYTQLFR